MTQFTNPVIKRLDFADGAFPSMERRDQAVKMAETLLRLAREYQTSAEAKIQRKRARIAANASARRFIIRFTDVIFRTGSRRRVTAYLQRLIRRVGVPSSFPLWDKLQLVFFRVSGQRVGRLLIPFVERTVLREMDAVMVRDSGHRLERFTEEKKRQHITLNLNYLGESVLGEADAARWLEMYMAALKDPAVNYISVKLSSIYSQINLLNYDGSKQIICDRLRQLYLAAIEYADTQTREPKFVNLDMEEYRYAALTADCFMSVLNEPEFRHYTAGLALQAYLPESFSIQQVLTNWAVSRVEKGGAPIRIRLVKGANMLTEKAESSLRNWPLPTFTDKADTDANFKRMLEYACFPHHAHAVRVGIGSHNIFDIAYGTVLRSEKGVDDYVTFEMLEGMFPSLMRAVHRLAGPVLLYCPVVKPGHLHTAIGYLMRRLDENSHPDNFLSRAFGMTPGSAEWEAEKSRFLTSFERIHQLPETPFRDPDRRTGPRELRPDAPFSNEPDTDWSLRANQEWGEAILNLWANKKPQEIPLYCGSERLPTGQTLTVTDVSRPGRAVYSYSPVTEPQAETMIRTALTVWLAWKETPFKDRQRFILNAATLIARARDRLLGAMAADTGKILTESDPEISEAVDFLRFYSKEAEHWFLMSDLDFQPKGVVLVATPWNFPVSIPAGGIAAALLAGNTVLFKPAPEAVLAGWHLATCFWEAGVPREVFQFIPCEDEPVGSRLLADPRIAKVILTGASATAAAFLTVRPDMDLSAETGGKNSLIITAMADRDLAIQDLVASAFGHSGQKCSAASLAIVETEVYDDPRFMAQLADAVNSLAAGSVWETSTKVGPLIREPGPDLLRALTRLEDGEAWLVKPEQPMASNPLLWSPGVKIHVQPGGYTHTTEFFGPVLAVIRAQNLDHAIAIANGTPYGLTAGIHSLDEKEHEYWKSRIKAGNLYINRTITGAIVGRQPFGGCKASSFGAGFKAGGANYLLEFMNVTQQKVPHTPACSTQGTVLSGIGRDLALKAENNALWEASLQSYLYWHSVLMAPLDPWGIYGQHNSVYCVADVPILMRFTAADAPVDVLRVLAAAHLCGAKARISIADEEGTGFASRLCDLLHFPCRKESEAQFLERFGRGEAVKVRMVSRPSEAVFRRAAETNVYVCYWPVVANGRVELMRYLREVSLSHTFHRYGNVS